MEEKYNPKKIEAKWQRFWSENKTFQATMDHSKKKYYVLDMFPYPSGAGLHVGHVAGYTASDIVARYKRHKGFSVLHPMGWDSFGLPAEQYAIRTGTHPKKTTEKNINNYRRQLKMLGFSYDWDREIQTSDPAYYKWTQWIFSKLYEKGLAYEAEALVNYCPDLGTVLANEEVEEGKSIVGGFPVERRPLRQWVLKITAYAQRLLDDLDKLDWPEGLKKLQRNWIGRSEGARVTFVETKTLQSFEVFTTRPDTLFGATYMVLAPEHPLVKEIVTPKYKEKVEQYLDQSKSKSDLQRTDLAKEKTGVFTGAYAINPVNDKKIPIWISDYVLMGYGTGAIMAVPAHDERDFAFAKKYDLDIISVFDPDISTYPDWLEAGQDLESLRKKHLQGNFCWPGEGRCIHSENAQCSLNGLSVDEAIKKITSYLEEKDRGSFAVSFKLRDWLFSRQRYWGEPFPVIHLEDGSQRVLNEDELPLCPPMVKEYKPSPTGESPLAKVPEWIFITDPKTGKKAKRESNTMPQWAGSCWYYIRFCDPHNDQAFCSKEAEKTWLPVDLYIGGAEHTVTHMLYARFWHKVLYDCGYLSCDEPFIKWRNPGMVTARAYQSSNGAYIPSEEVFKEEDRYFHKETKEPLKTQVEKMSKSKLNGVNPDEIIDEFGADALRLYEMFMAPLDKEKVWSTDAVSGCRRFLNRFYDLVHSKKISDTDSFQAMSLAHRLVDGVEKDIEKLLFNTAIAKMMEFVNAFSKLSHYPRSALKMAALVLSAFAPHLAEELWQVLGGKESVSQEPFPKVDPQYLQDDKVTYVVQVNGKVRARFDLPKDQDKEAILMQAKGHPSVEKYLTGGDLKKVIFVPNKLLNLVVV